jgi:hypothetical protein
MSTWEEFKGLIEATEDSRLSMWDAPAPLGTGGDLPLFPTEAFPTWLRSYVEALAHTTQTPPDLSAVLALAVLSALLAKKVEVHVR